VKVTRFQQSDGCYGKIKVDVYVLPVWLLCDFIFPIKFATIQDSYGSYTFSSDGYDRHIQLRHRLSKRLLEWDMDAPICQFWDTNETVETISHYQPRYKHYESFTSSAYWYETTPDATNLVALIQFICVNGPDFSIIPNYSD
jgi:hypothetical protein